MHAFVDAWLVGAHGWLFGAPAQLFAYLFVLLLINTVAPAISLWLLRRRGVISDLDIRNRRERPWPFLLVLAYYLMAYVLVVQSTAVAVPVFYQQVLLSLVVAIASAWVVTWKAKSACTCSPRAAFWPCATRGHDGPHMESELGVGAAVECGVGRLGRLRLGAHTPQEVYSGFVLGFLTVWITLF